MPDFLFSIPPDNTKLSTSANIAIQLAAIASRQVQNLRTRCIHPDGRDENVAEHSLMLAKVAPELAHVLHPKLDIHLVAHFATLHDDVEAYVGDTPTDILAGHDRETKEILEAQALTQLTEEYAAMPSYVELVRQYEAQSIPEARFVRAVDKLMVLLIHFPNEGKTLRRHYTRQAYLQSEADLLKRDSYKYGEFKAIMELRREIGREIAEQFLEDRRTT